MILYARRDRRSLEYTPLLVDNSTEKSSFQDVCTDENKLGFDLVFKHLPGHAPERIEYHNDETLRVLSKDFPSFFLDIGLRFDCLDWIGSSTLIRVFETGSISNRN
jgi:hypothetical protein